ncbi:hypothetical protein TNCV_3041181 [Trichonephila clavipes]|nr:hypothetical protein TNCV_3041181 [Trichonephila clavipes]
MYNITLKHSRANQNNAHYSLVESKLTGCCWHCSIYRLGGNFQKKSARVLGREISGEIDYFLEESRGSQTRQHGHQRAKMVAKVAKLAANLVVKYDVNLTLSPRFRQVLIESPL